MRRKTAEKAVTYQASPASRSVLGGPFSSPVLFVFVRAFCYALSDERERGAGYGLGHTESALGTHLPPAALLRCFSYIPVAERSRPVDVR
jgi:hypothetical protein